MTTTALWIEAGAIAAALLVSAAAVLVVALHLVATDVDPFTDGVSAYALTRVGSLYRIQVVATGFGALVLTLALVAGGGTSWIGFAALATFAAARILIARFPTDPRGTNQISSHGRAHILLAAVTFVTIAIAAPTISGALTDSQTWRGPTSLITALGWATTILALGTFGAAGTPTTRRFFGLVERGAYGAMLAWILLTALSVIWWILSGAPGARPTGVGSSRTPVALIDHGSVRPSLGPSAADPRDRS